MYVTIYSKPKKESNMKSYRFVVFTIVLTLILVSCGAIASSNEDAPEVAPSGPDYAGTLSAIGTKSAFETAVAIYTPESSEEPMSASSTPEPVPAKCKFHVKILVGSQTYFDQDVDSSYTHPDTLKAEIKARNVSVYVTTYDHGVFFNNGGDNWIDWIPGYQTNIFRQPKPAGDSTGFALWCQQPE